MPDRQTRAGPSPNSPAEIERGWEHILEPANYGRFEVWQATAHCLSTEDVIEAVRLER